MPLTVRAMTPGDWSAVAAVYAEGIAARMATFETIVPPWEAWDGAHLPECRLVSCMDGRVIGWAALSPVSQRAAYRGVAEASVYVAAACQGQGVGKALLTALVAASEAAGLWTLQATIFRENVRSLALFAGCGFRTVGVRERIAQLDGCWRDTVVLERRSRVVGS